MEDRLIPRALKAHIRLIDKILRSGLGVILIAPSGFGKSSIIAGLVRYYKDSREARDKVVEIVSANYSTLVVEASGRHKRMLIVSDDLAVQSSYSHNILLDFSSKVITDKAFKGYLVQGRMPLNVEVDEIAAALFGAQPAAFFRLVQEVENFVNLARDRFIPIFMLVPSLPDPLPADSEYRKNLVAQALQEEDPLSFDNIEERIYRYMEPRYTENRAKDYAKRLASAGVNGLEALILVNSLAMVQASVTLDPVEGDVIINSSGRAFAVGTQYTVQNAHKLGEKRTLTERHCALYKRLKRRFSEFIEAILSYKKNPTQGGLATVHLSRFFEDERTWGPMLKPLVEDVYPLRSRSPCEDLLLFRTSLFNGEEA